MTNIFDIKHYTTSSGMRVFSHSYTEEWKKTDYYCPNCGNKNVWCESGPGDYYVGEEHICVSCKHMFHLPSGVVEITTCEQDIQRLENITK